MKKTEIEIGKTYLAKVSGKMTAVKLLNESQYGGWNALNIVTHRHITIKSATQLLHEIKNTSYYSDPSKK